MLQVFSHPLTDSADVGWADASSKAENVPDIRSTTSAIVARLHAASFVPSVGASRHA
jgi:hypothetical protein